jgi:hypothetical protein
MLLACSGGASALGADRLLQGVDSGDSGRHVNIFVQLGCSARYLSQSPADRGDSVTVRLRLQPDCGPAIATRMTESATGLGASRVLRAVRLEEPVPGEIEITIEWSGVHAFVLAPATDLHGLRLRLLNVHPEPNAAVSVAPLDEPVNGYAVNLLSTESPIGEPQIAAASARLAVPLHVSTVNLDGVTWYRLRAGPFTRRSDAQRLLAVARQEFPRAWLAVADEAAAPEVALPAPEALPVTGVTDPALPDDERRRLLKQAREAMAAKDLPRAVELLTKLTRQPEYEDRARAQEMLGLARERAGQVAHAKAEYEEYLRRYPRGEAVSRVRSRLRALAGAQRTARGGLFDDADGEERAWRIDGGAAQTYRWERSSLTNALVDEERQDQNALYSDGDFVARRRGTRFDFVSRVSAGYSHDLLPEGSGRTRVSAAWLELTDRSVGVAARLGRQSRNSGGLLGTFDGMHASYQLDPRVQLNVAAGMPVESTRDAPQTDRRFVGMSAEFGPFREAVDLGMFFVSQSYAGETDRQAVGLEARYFVPGRTLLAIADYDLHYQELNSAIVMGSMQLPGRWTAGFSADHRRSPVLTTRNALIGQPVRTLDELLGLFSPEELEQLARDRTPLADQFSLSMSRPLGERFHLTLEAYASRLAATEASGNVAATPESGLEKTFQVQLSGSSLGQPNDLWSLSARHQDGDQLQLQSVMLAARLPLGPAWRLGPRLRVDRRESVLDGSRETLYVPVVRLDYQRGRTWLECEVGAQFGASRLPDDEESSRRYIFGVGYRVSF